MIGRSGREWIVRAYQVRHGHLRPHDGIKPHQVDLVSDPAGSTFGAFRRFTNRAERSQALTFLGVAGHAAPALLDLVDSAESTPAIVTAWAPGRSKVQLANLIDPDDLLSQLESGRRWKPADALRLLIPVADVLDRVAERGFVPLELSPDHLIENGGAIRLVGLGRHIYRPTDDLIPNPCGMSLPTTQLLCGTLPDPKASAREWRELQANLLLRLAGWMCGGLPPWSWGHLSRTEEQAAYLKDSGFSTVPSLEIGRLAATLADAARNERAEEAKQRIERAACVLFFSEAATKSVRESREEWQRGLCNTDLAATVIAVEAHRMRVQLEAGGEKWPFYVSRTHTPQGADKRSAVDLRHCYSTGDGVTVVVSQAHPMIARVVVRPGAVPRGRKRLDPVRINAESVRLGLLEQYGPDVVAVAALPSNRQASPVAALLSGAGWLLVDEDELKTIARTVTRRAKSARIVVAGPAGKALAAVLPAHYEEIRPADASGSMIAGRVAATLPYISDPDLDAFATEILFDEGGAALRRRTFPAGWSLAMNEAALLHKKARKDLGRQLRNELDELSALYGTDTELLLRVAEVCGRPAMRNAPWNELRMRLRSAAPVLAHMPTAGDLRNDLMHALLSRTTDTLYRDVTRWLLPVALHLSAIYAREHEISAKPLHELLYTRDGIRRLALLGRMATALPNYSIETLLDAVGKLDQRQVEMVLEVPAPSLQFLVGKLASVQLLEVLAPHIAGPDLDLLNRYTPRSWELLLGGLQQPEHLSALGLGWALVVERDTKGTVDARALLEIARLAGMEPRYAVRALLEAPTGHWDSIFTNRALSAVWLAAFGRFDLVPVLAVFPNVADLIEVFSPSSVRAAATADLVEEHLRTLATFAEYAQFEPRAVLTAFLNLQANASHVVRFEGPAAAYWASSQVSSGMSLIDTLAELIEQPGILRSWLVTGDRQSLRILSSILGGEPKSLGLAPPEGQALLELLESQPGLLRLTRTLLFPSQRLQLLRLAATVPHHSIAIAPIADALPKMLDEPDPDSLIRLILDESLTFEQAKFSIRNSLNGEERALLRILGPLDLTADLLAIAEEYGRATARDTGVLAQSRPDAPAAIRFWGPDWIPILAYERGNQIARLLASHPCPSEKVSRWLLAVGDNGLIAMASYGQVFLELVHTCDPPPHDVKLIVAILDQGGDAQSYRLIARFGFPFQSWPIVIANSRRPVEDLLLDVWSSDGWNPSHPG